ncbi:hypothetical protein [Longivirga aurantiaca]|uniref:Integral membrane protein n=1 Tax=Longivirga aurantiaca TaxID=1837743 RepID=A0ABW1T3K9_9ACTN
MSDEDVTELKARLAALEEENAQLSTRRRRFDGRSFGAWVVVVVAALLLPIALTAFWAQRTLTDTERYVATVAPLAEDPTIQQAVGDTVSAALIKQLDAQTRVSELLADNPKLSVLAGPIASGVNSLVERTVDEVLASDQFAELWVAINERAQKALIGVLEGKDDGAVTLVNGQLVLDTGDLIAIVKQRLVDRGLSFAANIPVPPAADRTIVLLDSPELARAQFFWSIGQPVAQWLIYVVMLMFLGAILLSRNRPKMTIAVGVSMVIGALVIRLALTLGQNQVSYSLQDTPFALAERAFFSILTVFLIDGGRALFVLGLILIVVGWFLSGTKASVATRTALSGVLSGAGGKASSGALGEVGRYVARTTGVWRTVIVALAVGSVLLADSVTGSLLLWTTLFAVIALVVVEFLAAAGRASAEHDDAPAEVAATSS